MSPRNNSAPTLRPSSDETAIAYWTTHCAEVEARGLRPRPAACPECGNRVDLIPLRDGGIRCRACGYCSMFPTWRPGNGRPSTDPRVTDLDDILLAGPQPTADEIPEQAAEHPNDRSWGAGTPEEIGEPSTHDPTDPAGCFCSACRGEAAEPTCDGLPEPSPQTKEMGRLLPEPVPPEAQEVPAWSWQPDFERKILKLAATTPLLQRPGVFRACYVENPARKPIAEAIERFHGEHPAEVPGLVTIDQLVETVAARKKPEMARAICGEWRAIRAIEIPDPGAMASIVSGWACRQAVAAGLVQVATILERGGDLNQLTQPMRAALEEAEAIRQPPGAARLLTPDEILALDLAATFPVIDPLLPPQGLLLLAAQRGTGKGWMGLQSAFELAHGRKWLGDLRRGRAAPRPLSGLRGEHLDDRGSPAGRPAGIPRAVPGWRGHPPAGRADADAGPQVGEGHPR